jgi:carbamoyltransferase
VGAALAAWHEYDGNSRNPGDSIDAMQGSFLGPSYTNEEIEQFLRKMDAPYERLNDDAFFERVAGELASGKVVGWLQGRMEFGPRALGGRSILGDARDTKMQSVMNLKIKYRESFRPFAPSVLRERVSNYFDLDTDSPYMLLVAPVLEQHRTAMTEEQKTRWGIDLLNVPKSDIPAVTHVDYSARIQTVHEQTNPRYYRLIKAFEAKTGCGVIVNTSFNVRGEPIVCSPEDAYRCFMRTDIDLLVLEDCLLEKVKQPKSTEGDAWRKEFVLD